MSTPTEQRPSNVQHQAPYPLVVRGPLAAGDLERLSGQVEARSLAEPGATVVCTVLGVLDLSVLDALARLQLTANRLGAAITVIGGADLLRRAGLSEVLRQSEPREQRGVQEVVDVPDLPG